MATKLIRKTASIFAGGLTAGSHQVEQFGSKVVTGIPLYTVDPYVIQLLSAWADGWKPTLNPLNNSEYLQDRNSVDLVASYQIAYLLQQGIAEWDSATPYFINSIVQYGGLFYKSLIDDNTGFEPDTNPAKWVIMSAQPTQTVLTSGSGTYTPPAGCKYIYVRMVGGGACEDGNGGDTTFGTYTARKAIGGNGGVASGGAVNINGGHGDAQYQGGNSYFGGSGNVNNSAANNSGSGAYGGGAGAYIEFPVALPGDNNYAIGAGGTGVAGRPNGGSGIIIIQEFYY
jgi:hypothetical protein